MLRKLHDAAEFPEHYFKRMVGRETFRLRVGDYRIIAEVDHGNESIHVHRIGHRKNIYR